MVFEKAIHIITFEKKHTCFKKTFEQKYQKVEYRGFQIVYNRLTMKLKQTKSNLFEI